MTLREKQSKLVSMLPQLINFAYSHGYELTLGEAYRDPRIAKLNAESGVGIKNSLHCSRLAIDLNLFKDGVYLTKSDQYKELGEFWESIGGTWGGRFNDGCHFSLEHNGIK